MDEAIGDPGAVKDFVTGALAGLFGVQVTTETTGFGIVTGNLPPPLGDLLPSGQLVKVSFESPTPEGYHYLGRNHRFVEQLCQVVMANTVAREGKRAARAAVIRTTQVEIKTTLLLFRCRNVIEQGTGGHQIVAEEMLLWAGAARPTTANTSTTRRRACCCARPVPAATSVRKARASFLQNDLGLLGRLDETVNALAEEQSIRLVAAHERFSALMDKQR